MQLFFCNTITNDIALLNEEESAHCIRVLRKKAGDVIDLIDGSGNYYKAEITAVDNKRCELKINEVIKEKTQNFHLHIAVAPTKNIERYEWFLEKVTEIGVHEITPLLCQHSERTTLKTERLQKILLSAIKQSGKATLPKLNQPIKFDSLILQQFNGNKYIAHCRENNNEHLQNIYLRGANALILIGPEGDFTTQEIDAAVQNKFSPVILAASRLRTETAAIVACNIVNLINE